MDALIIENIIAHHQTFGDEKQQMFKELMSRATIVDEEELETKKLGWVTYRGPNRIGPITRNNSSFAIDVMRFIEATSIRPPLHLGIEYHSRFGEIGVTLYRDIGSDSAPAEETKYRGYLFTWLSETEVQYVYPISPSDAEELAKMLGSAPSYYVENGRAPFTLALQDLCVETAKGSLGLWATYGTKDGDRPNPQESNAITFLAASSSSGFAQSRVNAITTSTLASPLSKRLVRDYIPNGGAIVEANEKK
jgi:hypothetical protein